MHGGAGRGRRRLCFLQFSAAHHDAGVPLGWRLMSFGAQPVLNRSAGWSRSSQTSATSNFQGAQLQFCHPACGTALHAEPPPRPGTYRPMRRSAKWLPFVTADASHPAARSTSSASPANPANFPTSARQAGYESVGTALGPPARRCRFRPATLHLYAAVGPPWQTEGREVDCGIGGTCVAARRQRRQR